MKITKQDLIEIIKEEISETLNEESDSLKIISLEPDEWKSEPGLGVGKMQAEYNGETYTFYTALTADEKDVQIYDETDTEVSEAFSEEQEQQIIAKMTTPEWKKETEEFDASITLQRTATPEEKAAHKEMVTRYKERMGYNEMKLTKQDLIEIIKEELNNQHHPWTPMDREGNFRFDYAHSPTRRQYSETAPNWNPNTSQAVNPLFNRGGRAYPWTAASWDKALELSQQARDIEAGRDWGGIGADQYGRESYHFDAPTGQWQYETAPFLGPEDLENLYLSLSPRAVRGNLSIPEDEI